MRHIELSCGTCGRIVLALCASFGVFSRNASAVPIRIGFLWHMHQPIYVPYLDPFGADPFFSYSVPDIFNQRFGPYTTWPKDAIDAGDFLPYLGAQVSFSGSLIESLNALEASGLNGGMWNNWDWAYRAAQSNLSALGNHRLEMVAFGYHHPLMPLNGTRDIRMQLRLHKLVHGTTWNTTFSNGLFPPETAFSERMIPALAAEGIEWVLVDNIHFDRACVGYPHTNDSGLFAPNRADQINPDPAANGGRWVQLQNLWAPSRVSVPFGYQPHSVQHVDPETGEVTRIVAVPAARYEGNEDGRGGYGAFLYDGVMDTYLPDNTDPLHPMFVVLHHDGDNFGGGSEAYYHSNFQNMVNWVQGDPDYEITTVNDYLDRFPVDPNDVIHVEDGSWAGADNGDAEFKKWLGGDVSAGGVSPDINSWAVLVAARNHVMTLEQIDPVNIDSTAEMTNILNGTGDPIHKAWHFLLVSQASDYWYWDGTEVWDSNVTRGCNQATAQTDPALASSGLIDQTPPTVFVPQREPYNPGGYEWGSQPEPSDFEVWTLAYDYSGLSGVTLRWRVDADGVNPISSIQNETFAGGPEVGPWQSEAMIASAVPTPAGVLNANARAMRYGAMITGQNNVLIDYYVEAVDSMGNVARSDIMHVWVGQSDTGGDAVTINPDPAVAGQDVTVFYDPSGGPIAGAGAVFMHYGFNGWNPVISPDAAMSDPDADGVWEVTVPVPGSASQLDLVFNDGNNNWDNNNGNDWHFAVDGGDPNAGFEMDGALDAEARLVASNGGIDLWAALDGDVLYLATTPASLGHDRFLVVAGNPGPMGPAMWAKTGQVAAWDAFLGNEADNGWFGWFDASGATQAASGAVLEATINLAGELGSVPASVFAAVLSYSTPDGGALAPQLQVPPSLDNDGDVEDGEYAEILLCNLTGTCCPADLNGDGILDLSDINTFVLGFTIQDPVADLAEPFGVFDLADISAFIAAFLAGCP